MKFDISQFALRNKKFTLFALLFVMVAALYSYFNHPSLEDPVVVLRENIITTEVPGMPPAEIEKLVTEKIETEIKRIPEIEEISSISKSGVSIVRIKAKDQYFDMTPIWTMIRHKMEDLKPELPKNTVGPIVSDSYDDVVTASIALSSDGFSMNDMRRVAEKIRDQLYQLKDVGKIELHGIPKQRVYITFDNVKISQYRLQPATILHAIYNQNVKSRGYMIEAAGRNIILAPTGKFNSINDIKNILIRTPNSKSLVRLGDIVQIKRGNVDPEEMPVFFDGKPCIILSIIMLKKHNVVDFGKMLKKRLQQIEQRLPLGYQIHYSTYQPQLVEESVSSFQLDLYETIAVVAIVVILILGLRNGLIVASIIPITVLITLLIMRLSGIELQRISITSLIISLGMLVDNAVVVTEDIAGRINNHTPKLKAILETSADLSKPLLTSTITTIFAFSPMLLSTSLAGEYTQSLAVVVAIALISSWFLAFYVIAFISFYFAKHTHTSNIAFERKYHKIYEYMLNYVIDKKYYFIAFVVAILIAAYSLLSIIPQQFFPLSSRRQFLINLDLPLQTSVAETTITTKKISEYLANKKYNPGIKNNTAYVGYGGVRFYLPLMPFEQTSHKAFYLVNTVSADDVTQIMHQVEAYILSHYPNVRPRLTKLWLGTTEKGLIEIRFLGPKLDVLKNYAELLKKELSTIPGIKYIRDNIEQKTLKVIIDVNQAKARLAGITSSDIDQSLKAYYDGITIGQFQDKDQLIPIVIRSSDSVRHNLDRIRSIYIYSQTSNKSIPLSQIATIKPSYQYSRIYRKHLQRTILVSAKDSEYGSNYVIQQIEPYLQQLKMPFGYTWQIEGEYKTQNEAKYALYAYIPISILAIILLLIWEFASFRNTLIILATIPASLVGAVAGLIITRAHLSFMALLGILSLAGIIINHGIVLVDRIQKNKDLGMTLKEAIISASMRRLRPILITTITTVCGLLPLMIFGDVLWYPLTSVLIFGLLIGTAITLFLIPVLCVILYRSEIKNAPDKHE